MPARTLEQVTAEIRFLDAQAGRLVMGHALEIGRRLTEAKAMVPYGEWGQYLERELHYTQTTANKLMKVFDEYGASQMGLFGPEVESEAFTNLTYSKALALLSVPREEREQFAREVDAEHLSTRELQTAIRERDEAKKENQTIQARLDDVRRELGDAQAKETDLRQRLEKAYADIKAADTEATQNERELKKRISELEARPIDVAVQEPDPDAVEKLAAELADKAKAELEKQAAAEREELEKQAAAAKTEAAEQVKKAKEKAKAEREKLESRLKEAEEKLSAAGEADRAEAAKLREEAEALRKKLAMSGEETVIFRLRFAAWQEAYRLVQTALAALPEESREKLGEAVKAQAKAWSEG